MWKPSSLSVRYNNFSLFQSNAFKSEGRAGGGLIILVNKHAFNSKLLHADENFIFIKLQKDDLIFIIHCVYISPLANMETVFSNLELIFNFINLNYDFCPVIIGGDFNGRIGNLNQIDENVYISSFIRNNKIVLIKLKMREVNYSQN